jgi:hypothetical protein
MRVGWLACHDTDGQRVGEEEGWKGGRGGKWWGLV